jgi:anti-sigma regulatory factor (Ser/Thr protein kinase)
VEDSAGVRIDASADSIAEARRMVVAQLTSWGLDDLADDARLIVSELLTNAALHAHPPVSMKLTRLSSGVKLEVSDGSTDMPIVQRVGTDVMTGRGWTLIAALSRDWGVLPQPGGKVIWATLQLDQQAPGVHDAPPDSDLASLWTDAALAAFDDDGAGPDEAFVQADLLPLSAPPAPGDDVVRYEVDLGEVPTDLLVDAKAQIDALIRECALMASGAATGTAAVPEALTTLIAQVVPNFSEARTSIKQQAVDAKRRGAPTTHLVLRLPLSAADAGTAYLAALDEVDAYCRNAQMLTLESSFQHRIFRHWYVGELAAGLRSKAQGDDAGWTPEPFARRLEREELARESG